MNSKKVAVANLPGKTKHYQTLFLPPDFSLNISEKSICLMDCPGLVFPSFTASKADMIINGIFRIDTITDYLSPIQIIISQIPSKILSNFYKIELPDIYSAKQFLQILAAKKGYFLYDNVPDEAKTSKIVLKDYVSGKLLFCYLRPDYTKEKFGYIKQFGGDFILNETEIENQKLIQDIPKDFDDNYEKLYMENEEILNNKKVKGEDVDIKFFNDIQKKEEQMLENETKPITKEMKRELKFAVKRGDLDEEEIEDIVSVADFINIMKTIEKNKNENNKGKKLIETRKINF
jgi:large subunit GTPase 1